MARSTSSRTAKLGSRWQNFPTFHDQRLGGSSGTGRRVLEQLRDAPALEGGGSFGGERVADRELPRPEPIRDRAEPGLGDCGRFERRRRVFAPDQRGGRRGGGRRARRRGARSVRRARESAFPGRGDGGGQGLRQEPRRAPPSIDGLGPAASQDITTLFAGIAGSNVRITRMRERRRPRRPQRGHVPLRPRPIRASSRTSTSPRKEIGQPLCSRLRRQSTT